jgi:hypothetical protein
VRNPLEKNRKVHLQIAPNLHRKEDVYIEVGETFTNSEGGGCSWSRRCAHGFAASVLDSGATSASEYCSVAGVVGVFGCHVPHRG